MKVYQRLAQLINAQENCNKRMDSESTDEAQAQHAREWYNRHQDTIDAIIARYAPSGSGFDAGTTLAQLDAPRSTPNKLIFKTEYHHMNDMGYYDGWTQHTITITPELASGFNMKVSGRDRNQIKDYIAETFDWSLNQEV